MPATRALSVAHCVVLTASFPLVLGVGLIQNYEDVVSNPEKVLENVFNFLDLTFDPSALEFVKSVDQIVSTGELWKANNSNELKLKDKLKDRLTPTEFDHLNKELSGFNLSHCFSYGPYRFWVLESYISRITSPVD